MGREEVLKRVKKGTMGSLVLGLTLLIVPFMVDVLMLAMGKAKGNVVLIIIMAVIAIGGGIMTVYFMQVMMNPMKSMFIRKNPDILDMADELYENMIYHDNALMFSPRIIGYAQDPRQLSYTDEVFLVYVYIHKTNGITDLKMLKIEAARRTIAIAIMGMKDEEINSLIGQIVEHCRYARVGYNEDSLRYLGQMKEIWKRDQESKKQQSI